MPLLNFIGFFRTALLLVPFVFSGGVAAGQVEDSIRHLTSSIESEGSVDFGDAKFASAILLPRLYEQRGHAPAWHGSRNVDELFSELNRGVLQGFRPPDFNLALLYELHDAARSGDPDAIAAFDVVATDAAFRLIHYMVFGKVDPSTLDSTWNFSRPVFRQDPASVLNSFLEGDGFSALMSRVYIGNAQYRELVDALQRYRAIERDGGWPVVPTGDVLKPGMSDPAVPLVRERLVREGMDGPTPVPTQSGAGESSGLVYDEALVRAIKSFQTRHGLEADGIIGRKTLESLNRTASDRVDQLRLSLERARWLMRDLDEEFVLVNIAGARTYLIKKGTIWTTRSVTGSAYRQTPVFRDEIEYMEFNPTWTVPASIFRKDKLPLIRADIGYLARNQYDVVRTSDRTPVNAAAVDWAADNPGVTLVQRPGPQNALGLVKFMFPNQYAVYLHDTNDRGLFDRNERNLSSGCVRLEHPFELASLLLEGKPDWSAERMRSILDSGETTRVYLDQPMPVLLTYWTAWVENEAVHFREDPYGRDGPILEALNR